MDRIDSAGLPETGKTTGTPLAPPVKLLVFAAVPPPHTGQTYLVAKMIEGFGGNHPGSEHGVHCFHVNARLSRDTSEMGRFRPGKFFSLFNYCLQAIWFHYKFGISNFYYVPAPPMINALRRDWIVLGICRLFYKNVILHWHAVGLATWIEKEGGWFSKLFTRATLGRVAGSLSLEEFGRADAQRLSPKRSFIVPNGIPDPCPDFKEAVLPRRLGRLRERQCKNGESHVVQVLFMSLCMEQKGLICTLRGIALANARMAQGGKTLRFQLKVAGKFLNESERALYDETIAKLDISAAVEYLGFLNADQKKSIFMESDLFCFPSFYFAESFPLALIEAMAYGLPSVVSNWRALPTFFGEGYPGVVDVDAPDQICDALITLANLDLFEKLRNRYLENFTIPAHLEQLARAIHEVEKN